MDLDAERRLDVGSPLMVGDRKMCVVSEIVSFQGDKGVVFAILISPVALIVFEGSQHYALSLVEGSEVTLEDLIVRDPSLRDKLSSDFSR
jgi:hypothetical protein